MSYKILLSPQIAADKNGDTSLTVEYADDDLVEEVKKNAISIALKHNLFKNKTFDQSKFGLGILSKGNLDSLLPNNQKFSVKAAASAQIVLVYLPDLDKEKGKDKWSFFKSADEKKKAAEVKDTRSKLSQEVLETERTYVQGLCLAIEVFLKPILANKLLPDSDVVTLFGGLEPIYLLNCKFLEDLENRISQWKPSKQVIGDLFFAFAPHFKQYAAYVSSYERSALLLVKLTDNSKFQSFLAECSANPKLNGQTLQSLLITPIQRIPRYNLLLQELLKNTPPTHEDYATLHKALQLVNTSAVFINEKVREQETRTAVAKVDAEFDQAQKREPLDSSGRIFARRGKFKLAQSSGKFSQAKFTPQKEYHLLLFSDLLVIAKNKKIGKYLKEVYRLKLTTVECTYSRNPPGGLALSWQEQKEAASLLFGASESEVTEWLAEVDNCLKKHKKLEEKEAAPTMPEESLAELDAARVGMTTGSKECRLCKKPFTLLFRRFHCKVCLFEVCEDCSKGRQPIDITTFASKLRVCDKCKHVVGAEVVLAEKIRMKADLSYTIRINVLPFYVPEANSPSSMRKSVSMLIPSPSLRKSTPLLESPTPVSAGSSSTLITKKYSQLKEFYGQLKKADIPILPDMQDSVAISKWLTSMMLISQKSTDPMTLKLFEDLLGIEVKFWGIQ